MFSCQQKKNFEGICLALQWGHSKLWILSVYKTVLWKSHLIEFYAYLWTCQVNKVKQDLHVICICKQKTFDLFRLNKQLKDLPVNLPNRISSLLHVCVVGNSFFDYF